MAEDSQSIFQAPRMSSLCHFTGDVEFTKLIGFQRSVSTTQAALEIARDARPGIEFQLTMLQIAALADDVRGDMLRVRNDEATLSVFCRVMSETHGFGGQADCFESADSSYLDRVIETRRGIPISLALVYMAVAEQLGLPLTGVAAPAHFLCRFESDSGPLFVDAYSGGRIMNERECIAWLGGISGLMPDDLRPTLQAATPRTIILRLLNNLKTLHLRKNDWVSAQRVLERLLALRPASFVDRRDLASVSLMLGRPGRVVNLFQGQLQQLLPEERISVDELLVSSRSMIAACN
jgi:regulator of sirC expression with transglutaminase-like and TPR domain